MDSLSRIATLSVYVNEYRQVDIIASCGVPEECWLEHACELLLAAASFAAQATIVASLATASSTGTTYLHTLPHSDSLAPYDICAGGKSCCASLRVQRQTYDPHRTHTNKTNKQFIKHWDTREVSIHKCHSDV